jgi:predicted kinase
MESIIFIGIQATGKSSFFKENFFDSHIRINLDMLRTRNREKILLEACLEAKQHFVSDNTNLTFEDRKKIIEKAKEKKFKVIGYYFQSKLEDCIKRNTLRDGKAKIPEKGLRGAFNRLEIPEFEEGFDELFYVRIENNKFVIEDWKDEIW